MTATLPIKIAFAVTDLDPGGAERALVELVTRLDGREWEPAVFCLSGPGTLNEPLRQAGIPVTCFGAADLWHAPGLIARLARELRRFRPSLLQTFLFHGNVIGRIAGRIAGVPKIVSGIRVAEKGEAWHVRLDRWTNRLVDMNICVSEGVARFSAAAGIPKSRLTVIPNGVDAERFADARPASLAELGIPPGSRSIIVVGRLDRQKGLLVLFEALRRLLPRFPDLHVLLVGEGPQEPELRGWVSTHGLERRIHFAGWQSDVPALLAAADFFALPSLWEGMPNAVLEAMAAGLPVVASEVEGIAELIEPERSGLIFPPGDVLVLERSVERLLTEPFLAKELARKAQATVAEEFTWCAMVRRYEQLYISQLESTEHRPAGRPADE